MTSKTVLTNRDCELLKALVLKVRLFSQRQIADQWWNGELANARRRLRLLAAQSLVNRITVSVRTLPLIETPLLTWQPESPEPDFGQVAYQLQSRWKGRAVRSTTAYIATDRAAQLYGGTLRGQLKSPLQATHDLGVSAIWLQLARQAPEWADAWRSEDLLAHTRRGEKLPDAFIVNQAGETAWVIEFGGSYDPTRVLAFHEDCTVRNLPYQIW